MFLQVVSGGQWRRVGYLADALLVNTGDLMEKWTLGTYKALVTTFIFLLRRDINILVKKT